MEKKQSLTPARLKARLYEIIFEADTPAGRAFDLVLLILIIASVLLVALESVESVRTNSVQFFYSLEWIITALFTAEYLGRLWVVANRWKYALSFFGIIDLLAIIPTYLALFFTGAQALIVIRSIRLIRIFRVLKLSRYIGEGQNLARALKASRHKIIVFLVTVLTSVVITGAIMYLIEGPEHGFSSIPISIYWCIVTMTTVGYGDIAPQTPAGQAIASFVMILGYGIIAVPTGIVSAEMVQQRNKENISTQVCPHCLGEGHDSDAAFCKYCGGKME